MRACVLLPGAGHMAETAVDGGEPDVPAVDPAAVAKYVPASLPHAAPCAHRRFAARSHLGAASDSSPVCCRACRLTSFLLTVCPPLLDGGASGAGGDDDAAAPVAVTADALRVFHETPSSQEVLNTFCGADASVLVVSTATEASSEEASSC